MPLAERRPWRRSPRPTPRSADGAAPPRDPACRAKARESRKFARERACLPAEWLREADFFLGRFALALRGPSRATWTARVGSGTTYSRQAPHTPLERISTLPQTGPSAISTDEIEVRREKVLTEPKRCRMILFVRGVDPTKGRTWPENGAPRAGTSVPRAGINDIAAKSLVPGQGPVVLGQGSTTLAEIRWSLGKDQ